MKTGNTSNRRQCLGTLAGMFGLGVTMSAMSSVAEEPPYPQRPITLVVPWPAGGSTDISMRILAEEAGKYLHQPVVVENRPGAGGTMAMSTLQTAKPDGYTLAQMPQPVFRIVHTQNVLWDPIRDTTPILQISGYTFGIVVPAGSAFRSVADLLNWGRAHPGELTVGSNGIGTTPHTAMQELMDRQGITYVHVPYKGTVEQMVAVASGQLMVGVNSTGFAPYVESGKLRLLATFGEGRSKRWPETPTMKELGLGVVAMSPYGIVGPRGLSASVVRTLHEAFKAAMHEPSHRKEIAKYDQELNYLGPEEYGRFMRETYAAEKRSVERLGQTRVPN
ncbi:tripartite tricarboxylate transporter substrate binding protein [Rhodoferax ferrireducens]|uniref:tripartite tricarboxylate transporter substrate binding protein n=1 Tax=Rhodoferax ferrireducens TaxID=192843 RepID=UPI000E0DACF8